MMRRLQWNGVAGGNGIDNGCNSIFNRFFGTVLLFVVMTSGMFGQSESLNCPLGTIVSNQMTFNTSSFTVIHAKGSDTNFAAYSPWRVYTNNTVTITGGSNVQHITSIVITAETNAYASAAIGGTLTRLSGTGTLSGSSSGTTATITVTGANVKGIQIKPSAQSRWTNIVINYTVAGNTATFKGNGATGGGTGGTGADYTQTASTTTALTANTFTRTGYTFAGWSTTAGGALAYADGANYAFGADITLYARWTPNNNTITFDKNHASATGTMANQTIATAATAALTTNTFIRSGYTFGGWATTSGGVVEYADGASYTMGTGNVTLYAVWITNSPFIDYTGTLTPFNTEYGTASAAQTLTVSGINLTGNLNLSIPGTLFEYSTDGISYSNTLSIAPSSGTVNATVYLRIKANVVPNSYSGSGNISSSGATIKTFGFPLSTVSPKNLTVTGISANNKTYDGTTAVSLSGTASITGIVGTDVVSLSGFGSGSFDNKNVGTGKTITVSGYTLTGTHEFRYTLTQPTGVTAAITPASVTIAATADNKTYDGTTSATIHPSVSGVIGLDNVTLLATGNFASPNAGTGITVNFTGVSLGGTDGGNYSIANTLTASADILKANQTITFGALADKTTADAPFNLTATASSGLTVTYSSSLPSVASVSGSTVTPVGIGTTVITASQAGDGNYNAALDVTQNQVVTSGPCFEELFTGLSGNNTTTGGSSISWSGNSNIASTTTAYEAGNAVRLGSGSASGSITSKVLTDVSGNVTVKFDVKGWTNVEGSGINVTLNGVTQNVTYTAVMSGSFESKSLTFNSVPVGSTLIIATGGSSGARRAFIRNVQIFCPPACTAPTTSATALTVTNPANSINSLNVNFTRGNGDGVLIIAKAGATPAAAPTSGTAYALNDAIDGGTVVYKGTASGVNTATIQTINSLLEGTQYQFSIYEYVAATNCYQAVALAGSGTTLYREIDIRGNSISIPNGSTTPSLANHTDFGSTPVDGGFVIRTFTIHNTGNTALSITNVNWTGADFVVSSMPSATVAGSNSTTFSLTFNPVAAGLRTSTITIINNDSDEGNYSFTVQGTGINSNASDIIADTGLTYTSNINYAAFQSATLPTASDGVAAFRFTVRDGGGTSDTDALGTELTGITFNVANSANIRTARLYDGTTLIPALPTINTGAGTISFSGMSGTNVTATDDGTKTLTLYVSFNTAVTDNDQLQFTVASATANASGSVFAAANAGGAASSITGDINRIEVTADRLVFGTQPASTSINTNLAPFTLRFVDANGNLDFDTNRTVTLTATDGGVNMSAAASYSITAPHTGIVTVSTVQFTSGPQTAITITGTTTGLAFDNDDKSSPFDIWTVVYSTNDYRTTSGGTWSTQTAGGTATWESWNGSAWVASNRPSATSHHAIIRHTVTSNGNTSINSITIEGPNTSVTPSTPGGNYSFSHTSTVNTKLLIKEYGIMTAGAALTNGGIFEVENHGIVNINYSTASGTAAIWNGTENFHSGSLLHIQNWNYGASGEIRRLIQNPSTISSNSQGYCFGNIKISGAPSAIFSMVSGNQNVNLAENDFTVETTAGGSNVTFSTSTTATVTVGGNVVVNSGQLSATASTNGTPIINILGNLTATSGTINLNQNSSTAITTLNLHGDLEIANSAFLTSTNSNSILNFNNSGDGLTPATTQTIDVANQSTAGNIAFNIKAGAYAKLINHNFTMGTGSALRVEASPTDITKGGTLDFGFDGVNSAGSTALNIAGPAFTAQPGSILKITSPEGVTSSGATGNVRTTSRTYAAVFPYGDYHYIGKADQNAGNGLPLNARDLTIKNTGASGNNNVTLNFQALTVRKKLTMESGNIVSTSTHLLELGFGTAAVADLGILEYSSGYVKGPMKRWFLGTNSGNASGLYPFGTAGNLNRFAKIEFTGAPTAGSLTLFNNTTPMGNAGLDTLSPIPATAGCPAFGVLSTDDTYWEPIAANTTIAGGVYTATLQKESTATDAICKHTLLKKDATDWLAPGTHVEPGGTPGNVIVQRTGLNGNAFNLGIGNGNCSKIPYVYNSGWPGSVLPTRFDSIEINSNLIITSGTLQACECKVNDNATLTINTGATLELQYGLTVENDGDFIINDSASLVQINDVDNATANNNTGNIKMHRYTKPMYRYDFTYWSSPVFANNDPSDDAASALNGTEFSLKKLSPMTLFDKYFKWNHATQAWQTIAVGAESMVPGRGYIVRAPQFYPVEGSTGNPAPIAYEDGVFIGKPNNGIVQHPVTGGAGKWNLIGNPYPSAISAASFLAANIDDVSNPTANKLLDGTLYFWTHNTDIVPIAPGSQIYTYDSGDYASWNGTGSAATTDTSGSLENVPSGFIAAGQSFFVQGTNSGSVLFNNSMRVAGSNNQFFRPGATEPLNNWDTTGKHRVWLNIKGQSKGFCQMLVGYVGEATNGLDRRFDGETFGGNQVLLYSVLEDKKLVIQGRALPFNNQDEVPLGYKSTLNGTLTISIDHFDGLFEGQAIYLEDKALDIVHDLKAEAYNFTTTAGTFNERFVLRYLPSEVLGNPGHEQIANGLIVYQEESKIMIKSQLETLEQVTIYDLLGRNIFDKSGIGQHTFSIQSVVMNEQPLIIKVRLANGQIVNKKIVY